MRRDYTHVKDIAQAVIKALDVSSSQLTQRIFNIGSGTMYSASQVAEAIRTILPDADVLAQIARLEQALKARKAWLKQPINQRDPKAIAAMFASSDQLRPAGSPPAFHSPR